MEFESFSNDASYGSQFGLKSVMRDKTHVLQESDRSRLRALKDHGVKFEMHPGSVNPFSLHSVIPPAHIVQLKTNPSVNGIYEGVVINTPKKQRIHDEFNKRLESFTPSIWNRVGKIENLSSLILTNKEKLKTQQLGTTSINSSFINGLRFPTPVVSASILKPLMTRMDAFSGTRRVYGMNRRGQVQPPSGCPTRWTVPSPLVLGAPSGAFQTVRQTGQIPSTLRDKPSMMVDPRGSTLESSIAFTKDGLMPMSMPLKVTQSEGLYKTSVQMKMPIQNLESVKIAMSTEYMNYWISTLGTLVHDAKSMECKTTMHGTHNCDKNLLPRILLHPVSEEEGSNWMTQEDELPFLNKPKSYDMELNETIKLQNETEKQKECLKTMQPLFDAIEVLKEQEKEQAANVKQKAQGFKLKKLKKTNLKRIKKKTGRSKHSKGTKHSSNNQSSKNLSQSMKKQQYRVRSLKQLSNSSSNNAFKKGQPQRDQEDYVKRRKPDQESNVNQNTMEMNRSPYTCNWSSQNEEKLIRQSMEQKGESIVSSCWISKGDRFSNVCPEMSVNLKPEIFHHQEMEWHGAELSTVQME
eukprot:g5218.t1